MQKNSTSTIVRRSLLAITFIALTHLIARLMWQFQVFGLNSIEEYCYYPKEELGDGWISYGDPVCDMIGGTSFFEYTGETWPIIGTHLIGLVASIVIFALITWIFFGLPDEAEEATDYVAVPDCTNANCPCVGHTAEVFEDGKWTIRTCTNPNCTCKKYHYDEVFDTNTNQWVPRE